MNHYFTHRFPQVNLSQRTARWLIFGVLALGILALMLALAVPGWLKSTLEQQIPQQTGRQFTVEQVAFNPLTLRVTLSGLQLLEADNKTPAFSADRLSLRVSFASLFRLAPVIGEIALTHPQLHLVRSLQAGREVTNFSDVIARFGQKPSSGEPLRFSIYNIQLDEGNIDLDDQIAGKKIHIEKIKVGLPFLSTFPSAQDVFIEPALSAIVDGSLLELKGETKPFSDTEETTMAIDIDRFHLNELTAFVPHLLPLQVKSAILTTRLIVTFQTQKDRQRINLSGTVALDEVDLADRSGAPLFASKAIHLNLNEADLANKRFVLNSLEVTDPQIWLGLDQQGGLNWAALQKPDNPEADKPVKPEKSAPLLLELTHLQIKNGTLHWSDAANASPALALNIGEIGLDVAHLSNYPKSGPAKIKFLAGPAQQLHFDGEAFVSEQKVTGRFGIEALPLQDYQAYFGRVLAAAVTGKLNMQTGLEFQNGNLGLHELSASLEALSIQAVHKEDGSLSAKTLAIAGMSLDSATRQVSIDQITLDQINGAVIRDANGEINLSHLVLRKAPAPPLTTPAGAAPPPTALPGNQPAPQAPAWQTLIRQVAMTGSSLNFSDQSVQPAVVVNADAVELKLENISGTMDSPVKVALRATLNKTGQFVVDGTANAQAVLLNLNVQNFAVAALQPYFTQFLNIQIASGSISTRSTLKWTAPALVNFQGGVTVTNLATTDKENDDDFLRWKLLDISGINVDLGGKQPAVTLGKVNLDNFYARAILSQQGHLNLQDILVQSKAPGQATAAQADAIQVANPPTVANTPAGATTSPVISLGPVNFSNGTINYTDNFIKPHYSMRMTGVQGSIGAMRSDQAQAAPVILNGRIDDEAPLAISGTVNPLYSPLLLNIKLTASEIELPRLTTYSLKYAGYPIIKGELSLDVDYHVKDNQLTANNSLILDQLTFGDKVEGPDATHLPVPFLISLLTDSEGRINLDLPISGTLNDPQFSIGGLIGRVFLDMVEKVAISPFALLAHSFGHTSGGDELAYIEFDSGSAILSTAAKNKLDTIVQALKKRPALQLDVSGRADVNADTEGLRHQKLEAQIRRFVYPDGEEGANALVSIPDRARAVNQIYSAAKFTKPRNALGIAKTLPVADMEQLIITNTVVTDDDIRDLALQRESVVHAYLTDADHVAPERIYAVAPRLSGEGITDKGAISRVDLDLKM